MKKVRNQLKRYRTNDLGGFFQKADVGTQMENIIAAFANCNKDFEYKFGMLALLGPLMVTFSDECDTFCCFQALMKKMEHNFSVEHIATQVSKFMEYFRSIQPELCNHFEEEEINCNDWVTSWLRYYLSCELPMACVLRLWDTYLANFDQASELHICVCLAILNNSAEELLELEQPEILSFLQHLPVMDIDKVISRAYLVRDWIKANKEL